MWVLSKYSYREWSAVQLELNWLWVIHIVQFRAGASYFRLVWPLRCEQGKGVWGHAPPGKFFKLGTLRLLLRPCLGQNATKIAPSVVSVAREVSCQKWPPRMTSMLVPPQFARSPRAQVFLYSWKIEKPHFSCRYFGCLKAWKVWRRPLRCPKLQWTARRGHL